MSTEICLVDEELMLQEAAVYAGEWAGIEPNADRVGDLLDEIIDGDGKIDRLAALFSKEIAAIQYRRWRQARDRKLTEIAEILDEEGI